MSCLRTLNRPHTSLNFFTCSPPGIDCDKALLIAPSLNTLRELILIVSKVKCGGLNLLFEACVIVEKAFFRIKYTAGVEIALDCIAELLNVARTKDTLRKIGINIEPYDRDGWDDDMREQFKKGVSVIAQKMRFIRCEVDINS